MGIRYSSVVAFPQEEAFAWHERPGPIARLSPPFQPVRVVREATRLSGGTAVLRLPGGLKWVAKHEEYDPPELFVDRLTSLPLRWRHVHRFEAVGTASTRITDEVESPVPERVLRPMFVYRHRQVADDLRVQKVMRALAPMPLRIGISGASGLVGRALTPLLTTAGHDVFHFVRRDPHKAHERRWDPAAPDPSNFEDIDAFVHLAGASIAGRFSESHKRTVRESRIGPTAKLAAALAQAERPSVFASASAIGFYGPDRGNEELVESSTGGCGFVAALVSDWEHAALEASEDRGIRCVVLRTGIVQSPQGGVLRLERPIFAAGMGGRLGSGQQWLSWIDLDDLCDIYFRAIVDDRCRGPINAVAPQPVTNSDYTAVLAHVLRRPAVLKVPSVAVEALAGPEAAHELALASQRVVPEVLTNLGHHYRRPDLESCLRHQLGRFGREPSSPN
jgi:hypothetical protein